MTRSGWRSRSNGSAGAGFPGTSCSAARISCRSAPGPARWGRTCRGAISGFRRIMRFPKRLPCRPCGLSRRRADQGQGPHQRLHDRAGERIETVEYFHIELDRHDVIIAETYRNPRRRRPRHVPQRARIACALSRHGSERSTRSAPMRSRAGHRTTTSRKRRSVSISSSADAAPDRCWQTLARGPRGGRHRPSCLQV